MPIGTHDDSIPIGTPLRSRVPNGDSAHEESRYVHEPNDSRAVLEREPVHTPVRQDSMLSVRPAEHDSVSEFEKLTSLPKIKSMMGWEFSSPSHV